MLLEREHQLRLLGDAAACTADAGGKVVLIRGEAGIGKSSLVRAFIASRGGSTRFLVGACDDLLIPQPLGPFWDIARQEPALRAPLDAGDRLGLFQAVLDQLASPGRPSVLIIEDTQWADEATMDAIRYLGRRVAAANALMVVTFRDGDVDLDHPLRGVIGEIPAQDVLHIRLGGLSLEAVRVMLADRRLDPRAVFEATTGNPFLVTEMVVSDETGAPASLDDAVIARVRRLSIGAQEALKTLAVIPEPIPRVDALRLDGVDDARLDECQRRELLDERGDMIAFRHELIRRAVERSLTAGERLARHRVVLMALPEETHPSLIIHCAAEGKDVERLVDVVPRSASYAVRMGSHIQAVEDFRQLGPHLDRLEPLPRARYLEDWAHEEFLMDDITAATRLSGMARELYRSLGDRRSESAALARAAHYFENGGERARAEELAQEAITVLGDAPGGADLARALEVNAYLQMMAGNVRAVPELVERTLRAGGADIDEGILIRALNHRGIVANIAAYPAGRVELDEARRRSEAAGNWYEECRALVNHAWAAAEAHDLPIASDYAQRAIVSGSRHEMPNLEHYARAMYARVLDLEGRWDAAGDIARDLVDSSVFVQMVVLPILGVIEARHGRPSAASYLQRGWRLSVDADEVQRLAPAAIAAAEHEWIHGDPIVTIEGKARVLDRALDLGFSWSPGKLAYWMWRLGQLDEPPAGIAEPWQAVMGGAAGRAAGVFRERGLPYEEALATMHGDVSDQIGGLELLETLGASAVAARFRRDLRDRGVSVPRGRGRETRRHAAGLTIRQAEILRLLAEDLSNAEIADRLFISPRTVENHVAAVLDKLDVASRADAVSRARADGLLGTSYAQSAPD
jgi:DNA-binding CsgD family transcriptional regulator